MGGAGSTEVINDIQANDERRTIFNNAVGVNFESVGKGTQAGTYVTLELKVLNSQAADDNEKAKLRKSENVSTKKAADDETAEKERLEKLKKMKLEQAELNKKARERIEQLKEDKKKQAEEDKRNAEGPQEDLEKIRLAKLIEEEERRKREEEEKKKKMTDLELMEEVEDNARREKEREADRVKSEAERKRLADEMKRREEDAAQRRLDQERRIRERILLINQSQMNLLGISAALNDLRTNPRKWANIIEIKYLERIDELTSAHSITNQRYFEGRRCMKEAIRFLRRQVPLSELFVSDGLTIKAFKTSKQQAESDWTVDGIKPVNQFTTKVENDNLESSPKLQNSMLMSSAFGIEDAQVRRELEAEPMRELETLMVNLVVDDGIQDRHHRKQIFNPMFTQVGIGVYKYRDSKQPAEGEAPEKYKVTLEYATSRYQTITETVTPKERKESGLEFFHQNWKQVPLDYSKVDFMVAFSIPVDHTKMQSQPLDRSRSPDRGRRE